MASVTSGPFGFLSERGSLLRPTACLRPSLAFLRLVDRPRRSLRTCCEAKSNPTEPPEGDPPPEFDSVVTTSVENSSASTQSEWFPALPNKSINRRIALASTFAALGLFVSSRLDLGVSLKDLSSVAVPYEEALLNGRPTVVEFYADWCEVCRELAPDIYRVEQKFKDHVNFVMLNVDNTKWEQELDEFDVEGIPHFTFLDKNGNAKGSIVGRLPKKYLLENVESLARGEPSVPHSRVVGQFSSAESRKANLVADPRSHG